MRTHLRVVHETFLAEAGVPQTSVWDYCAEVGLAWIDRRCKRRYKRKLRRAQRTESALWGAP